MLFVLSNELLPFCSNKEGVELEGLQNLLLCARQGRHALTGANSLFLALSKNDALAARERATALGLVNRRAELPLLEASVKHKIYVKSNVINKISRSENGCFWEVDVTELKAKFLSSLVILAENAIDAELYQRAARHHQISKQIKGVVICSSTRGGGGSQIDIELKSLLAEGIPVFAITDGDFLFPGMPSSVISRRCVDLIAENRGVGWHFSLPVREIENIIPFNVLFDVADPANARSAFDSTQELAVAAKKLGNFPCDFLCLKSGSTLAKVFTSENATERAYLIEVAETVKHLRPVMFATCIEKDSCVENTCACFLSHGFGENVLKQVKKWISERSAHDSLHSFGSSGVWMSVGEKVFDASIAFKPANI